MPCDVNEARIENSGDVKVGRILDLDENCEFSTYVKKSFAVAYKQIHGVESTEEIVEESLTRLKEIYIRVTRNFADQYNAALYKNGRYYIGTAFERKSKQPFSSFTLEVEANGFEDNGKLEGLALANHKDVLACKMHPKISKLICIRPQIIAVYGAPIYDTYRIINWDIPKQRYARLIDFITPLKLSHIESEPFEYELVARPEVSEVELDLQSVMYVYIPTKKAFLDILPPIIKGMCEWGCRNGASVDFVLFSAPSILNAAKKLDELTDGVKLKIEFITWNEDASTQRFNLGDLIYANGPTAYAHLVNQFLSDPQWKNQVARSSFAKISGQDIEYFKANVLPNFKVTYSGSIADRVNRFDYKFDFDYEEYKKIRRDKAIQDSKLKGMSYDKIVFKSVKTVAEANKKLYEIYSGGELMVPLTELGSR